MKDPSSAAASRTLSEASAEIGLSRRCESCGHKESDHTERTHEVERGSHYCRVCRSIHDLSFDILPNELERWAGEIRANERSKVLRECIRIARQIAKENHNTIGAMQVAWAIGRHFKMGPEELAE
jgi:hypothetical protein